VRKRIADRRQGMLLPPSIDEYVGARHRVRVIVEVVESLDLSGFHGGQSEDGRPAYPPEILVSLILYAYSVGVFSAREMERRCRSDCVFMFAAAGERLSHRTISRFRAAYQEALSDLFAKIVQICRRAGLGDTCRLVIDGTRQHANASMDAHVRKEQLEKEHEEIRKDIDKLLSRAAEIDAAEEAAPPSNEESSTPEGMDRKERQKAIAAAVKEVEADAAKSSPVDEEKVALPSGEKLSVEEKEVLEWKKKRKEKIETKLKELEERGAVEANETDPEARLQRFNEGSRPGYNAQLGVTGNAGLIVAADVTQDPADMGQLIPMCDQAKENTGAMPGVVTADAGYESGENFSKLAERGQDAVIASASYKVAHKARERTGLYQWVDFDYDAARDEYVCPAGRRLLRGQKVPDPRVLYVAAVSCGDCPLKKRCTTQEKRILNLRNTSRFLLAMSKRRAQDRRTDRFGSRRKGDVESVFGHMKHNLRWRQFARRGLVACRSEFRILCAAINLAKLTRFLASKGCGVAQVPAN